MKWFSNRYLVQGSIVGDHRTIERQTILVGRLYKSVLPTRYIVGGFIHLVFMISWLVESLLQPFTRNAKLKPYRLLDKHTLHDILQNPTPYSKQWIHNPRSSGGLGSPKTVSWGCDTGYPPPLNFCLIQYKWVHSILGLATPLICDIILNHQNVC